MMVLEVIMPRLRLHGYKGAFLDIRPVSRESGFGLSVLLRIRPSKGCSGLVVQEEYLWPDGEALLDHIKRFLLEGNLTIPGEPGIEGIQFRLQYKDDEHSALKVSCRMDGHVAHIGVDLSTQDAWRFVARLLHVCEGLVAGGG